MNTIIPIDPVPSQTFQVQLGNQSCSINLYQKNTGLYFDLTVNNNQCVQTMLCLNLVGLVREAYQGFTGQLFFFDTQGTNEPYYTGFGSRYLLLYQS
jgi:hypothetical protein